MPNADRVCTATGSSTTPPANGIPFGNASSSPLLTIAPSLVDVTNDKTCNTSTPAVMFYFTQAVGGDPLETNTEHFVLESTDGGAVQGSNGSRYFTNIKLMDRDTHFTVGGPTEIMGANGSSKTPIVFIDSFTEQPNTTQRFAVVATLGCSEDVPGEFFGHHYRLVKQSFALGDVINLATSAPLPLNLITPQSNLLGVIFHVVAP
jgi:hypothetical protein